MTVALSIVLSALIVSPIFLAAYYLGYEKGTSDGLAIGQRINGQRNYVP